LQPDRETIRLFERAESRETDWRLAGRYPRGGTTSEFGASVAYAWVEGVRGVAS
jgi:hypothetical protein